MIINGYKIAQEIYLDLKRKVKKLSRPLGLGIVLVGNNPASIKFSNVKAEKSRELGVFFKQIHLPAAKTEEDVINAVNKLNVDKKIDGIIVQLPLPKKFNTIKILSQISQTKDIEGLNPLNFARLISGEKILTVAPATVMKIIDHYKIKLAGEHVTIINDSYLIGKPLAYLLLNKKATITICNSYSDLQKHTKTADMIISAVGQPHLIKSGMVKNRVIIFDLGFSLVKGRITGDVEFDKVKKKCKYITPNPGGIGPITVAMLFINTYLLRKKNNGSKK